MYGHRPDQAGAWPLTIQLKKIPIYCTLEYIIVCVLQYVTRFAKIWNNLANQTIQYKVS